MSIPHIRRSSFGVTICTLICRRFGNVSPFSLASLILLAPVLYFGFGYALGRALESKGLRQLIGGKTAKILDTSAGYLPLTSDGLSVSSSGFLAKAFRLER